MRPPNGGPATAADGGDAFEEISSLLPLRLSGPQIIPPAPTRRAAAIDFLHDFGGAAWIAYGAAHLLVVSHLPSPEPRHDAHSVGPFFRQVVELPVPCADDGGRPVSAVAWCPARPSMGELVVARGEWVWLYAPSAGNDPGSFWWTQTVGILQSFAVGAIGWTGSGDGLVVAGIEVVLWTRKSTCWEAAWRSRAEVPQSLVSASWFSERYVATAAGVCAERLCPLSGEESSCVLVHHCNGTYGITKVRLCHPQPVSVIQWRPSTLARMKNRDSHPWRDILLTCCLDGTVRLWSEIDSGRANRSSKDIHDTKNLRLSFHVITVIEINQCLKGNLGRDISIAWAMEFGGVISRSKGDGAFSLFEGYENDTVGRCEWLICVGPKSLITFWAIHCLDDMSPLRFPRVTMWKKQDLKDFTEHDSYNSDLSSNDWPILVKAAVCRNWQFGPPILCSLIQLLPNNSFCWSQLSPTMNDLEGRSLNQNSKEKSLSCFVSADLYQDGHTGTIIQLAVHPYSCEIELAASLDSNGFLLIWSLSTPYSCTLGMQMFIHPAWKLLGKIILQDLSPNIEYSCLRWAPSVLEDNKFVLLGHKDGVDCFVIGPCGEGGNIICQKILTVPFSGHDRVEGPPNRIFATPIASTSERSFVCNSFLLFAVWMKKFQALSWKVVLHSEDPSQNSKCDSNENNLLDIKEGRVTSSFTGRMYHGTADLVSSTFPDSQDIDQVTSYALVSLDNSVISVQQPVGSLDNLSGKSFPYHLATGFSDGTLKLWRISHSETRTDYDLQFPWELVGAFIAHEGPVSAVSLSSCGSRIATVTMTGRKSITTLHIWESICLIHGGGFLLEDVISFNEPVVALNWLSIGNGQLLLGVCTANELRVYSERSIDQTPVESEKTSEMHIWFCIASSPITYFVPQDFLWGPKAALMLVYERLFSLFTPWLFRSRKEYHKNHPSIFVNEAKHSFPCTIYPSRDNSDSKSSLDNEPVNANGHNDRASYLKMPKEQCDFHTKNGVYSMLHIAGRFRGMLAVYHPKALIQYLYSGNWKRAYVILKHLVGYIKSNGTSVTNSEINKSQISFQGTPEIPLSTYFEENISKDLRNKVVLWGQETAVGASTLEYQRSLNQSEVGTSVAAALENTSISALSKSEIMGLIDVLENSHEFASIKDIDRNEILAIVELLGEISDSCHACAYESLDEPGRRFWVAVRFQHLHYIRKLGRLAAAQEFIVKSDLIASAFQSDCQDLLFSSVFSEEPSWVEMRNFGVGFWFINAMQLRTRMEKLARSQYLKRKDPKDCALLYLALNRVQVLAGLFKVSRDEKNKALVGFLSRNFQEEKNKAAALKNAYFLMGRHELELAIAFFLLGGDPSSAVTVCAKNLGDEQLALVLCRLIEGYGGPLERQLISNFLLPNAIDKGDYWLSSLLEWTLGNYSRSLKRLFYSHTEPVIEQSATLCNHAAFSDPNIAQHCVILISKNCFKNSIGDYLSSVATKFALFMGAKALNRCGLPLEALECLPFFRIESKDEHGSFDIENHEIFHGLLNPFSSVSGNWLLGGVACHLELNSKMNMALLYIGKLLRYHPYYRHANLRSSGEPAFHNEYVSHQEEFQVEEFNNNLNMAVSMFEHKHSVKSIYLAEMILVFTCNKELLFLGYQWLQSYMHQEMEHDVHSVDSYMLTSTVSSLLLKASKEISYIVARSVVSGNFADSTLNLSHKKNLLLENNCYNSRLFCLQSVLYSMRTVRPLLKLYRSGSFSEGSTLKTSDVLVLLEFFIYFASAWFKGNLKGLILMIYPILNSFANGQSTFEIIAGELMELLHQNPDLVGHDISGDVLRKFSHSNGEKGQYGESESLALSIPDEEKWLSIAACLWIHLSNFAEHQFTRFLATDEHETESTSVNLINLFPMVIARLLMTSFMYISSSFTKQFASYLRQKTLKGLPVPTLSWLKEYSQSLRSVHSNQEMNTLILPGNQDREFMSKILWEISVSPREICDSFLCGRVDSFSYNSQKLPQSWQDLHESILAGYESSISPSSKMEDRLNSSLLNNEEGLLLRNRVSGTYGFPETRRKDTSLQRDITSFHGPKEVLKRTGELVEAICCNSVNEQQVALLSNRKGLLFFDMKSEEPSRKDTEYIWSVSDWPQDGWAGCESIPIPTYVSPGIGLGSKRGAQLGLGGATIGFGSLARPGRDLTGGGAFGIPGYAGIGASGLGWGEMEEFEEYVDPPATVENIRSRALSRHPSKPFFLVGSSNTHVYLWEFGKDRATATYGILPAANVPPPYALASVSALQFDHCGQRFATAALDGTVCTWQVEVGGRSNVHPIESTLCFNNHASDVAYLASSGSILAAAGGSSSGVNVVVWDTLAPPATSQASLVCHEGGARSLSVFDNDIGNSSISPLIVTGGKSGDVGLHDFRFIATGRTKRHRHSSNHDLKSSGGSDTASGTKSGENVNGMIWYIPKAHLGSITRISTIPNTSLFLTGSKDGDVKLWDAKRCELVHHWQKLHDRHTFLQPNSRGFGGVVRAAVTDIQVLSQGFLTCGGDGSVKLIRLG